MPDYEKLVDQIVATNADGFNGDTLDGVNKTWYLDILILVNITNICLLVGRGSEKRSPCSDRAGYPDV